ncbi:MAG: Gfo/Idh/MocA family oxidoreductase [Thermoguttaceae bacterium]|nr:Gfo/Idh/MocA family oxidoreductase [Thermoguttaceae bacterium]
MKKPTRRDFIKAGLVAAASSSIPKVHAGENNLIRIGLVGCSGRGRGALFNAKEADANWKLTAVGDVLPDKANVTLEALRHAMPSRVDVKPECVFIGPDCRDGVIANCDLVFSTEIPAFRPWTIQAAVRAGKHIFAEKPAAVDPVGMAVVTGACEESKRKKLNLVSGLCWRFEPTMIEIMKRINDGILGEILAVRGTYLTSHGFTRATRPGDNPLQQEIRAWYNLRWCSGDFLVEQTVHNLDMCLWAFGDKYRPENAFGVGGRMARVEQPQRGDIYDSMGVSYNLPGGRTIDMFARQQNCWYDMDGRIIGTKGYTNYVGSQIVMRDWSGHVLFETRRGKDFYKSQNRFVEEQRALFGAIRSGQTLNNSSYMCSATKTAILGREAVYSGKNLSWEEVDSLPGVDLGKFTLDSLPPYMPDEKGRYKIPVPGIGLVNHTVIR